MKEQEQEQEQRKDQENQPKPQGIIWTSSNTCKAIKRSYEIDPIGNRNDSKKELI